MCGRQNIRHMIKFNTVEIVKYIISCISSPLTQNRNVVMASRAWQQAQLSVMINLNIQARLGKVTSDTSTEISHLLLFYCISSTIIFLEICRNSNISFSFQNKFLTQKTGCLYNMICFILNQHLLNRIVLIFW